MPGKNIKQLTTLTSPVLTDFLYGVSGTTDYNIQLSAIKNLFGIGDVDEWVEVTIPNGTTVYENLDSGIVYASIELIYAAKRGSRGYATGRITLLVDDSTTSGLIVSDFKDAVRSDYDVMGLTLDEGALSAGTIQLKLVADASDANDTIFNYQIVNKRPITVT